MFGPQPCSGHWIEFVERLGPEFTGTGQKGHAGQRRGIIDSSHLKFDGIEVGGPAAPDLADDVRRVWLFNRTGFDVEPRRRRKTLENAAFKCCL